MVDYIAKYRYTRTVCRPLPEQVVLPPWAHAAILPATTAPAAANTEP
jgi:hypothetical protein